MRQSGDAWEIRGTCVMSASNAEQKAARKAERERAKFENLDSRTWFSAQQWAHHVGIAEGTAARYFALGIGPRSILIGNGRRVRCDWSENWILEGGVTRPDRAAILRAANKMAAARRDGAQAHAA
jgi:hypothetical protein